MPISQKYLKTAPKHAYRFDFTILNYRGSVTAVSVPQAVSRVKAMYAKNVLGHGVDTPSFRMALLELRDTPVMMTLDPIARQRCSELYREAYQLGIEDVPTQIEFAQLQDIVNTLHNLKG